MNTQLISRDGLKEIYDVACNNWKLTLQEYAKRNPFQINVELTQSEVDAMFKASDNKQTILLKKFFKLPVSLIDKIKSFKDACEHLGIDPNSVYSSSDTKDEIAYKRLKVIIKALNDGWYPNWKDKLENKFFNYFYMNNGAFSYSDAYYDNAIMYVPSALYLRTRELAVHCLSIAMKDYEDYYS